MANDDDDKLGAGCLIILVLVIILLILGIWFGWSWYKASVQRAVYERQGVTMTTWEILMGAKPVERAIVTPPAEQKQ